MPRVRARSAACRIRQRGVAGAVAGGGGARARDRRLHRGPAVGGGQGVARGARRRARLAGLLRARAAVGAPRVRAGGRRGLVPDRLVRGDHRLWHAPGPVALLARARPADPDPTLHALQPSQGSPSARCASRAPGARAQRRSHAGCRSLLQHRCKACAEHAQSHHARSPSDRCGPGCITPLSRASAWRAGKVPGRAGGQATHAGAHGEVQRHFHCAHSHQGLGTRARRPPTGARVARRSFFLRAHSHQMLGARARRQSMQARAARWPRSCWSARRWRTWRPRATSRSRAWACSTSTASCRARPGRTRC